MLRQLIFNGYQMNDVYVCRKCSEQSMQRPEVLVYDSLLKGAWDLAPEGIFLAQ